VRPFAKRLAERAIPFTQTYMRRGFAPGKRLVWQHLVEPRIAYRSYPFICETNFGAKVAGNTEDLIGRYLYYFGVWEPNLTRWIGENLAAGDTFIDVGANIGYFTLLAAHLVGSRGAVVAIEPSPSMYAALRDNIRLNGLNNVHTINAAVYDRRELVPFYRGPQGNAGMASIRRHPDVVEFECTVSADVLPELCTVAEIASARIIKIDVEGLECEAASGLKTAFPRMRPDAEIVIEVVPEYLAAHGRHVGEAFEIFETAGFHAYHIENDYTSISYVPPRSYSRPQRIRAPLEHESDVIFSRRDADTL
jgi:FkbM family methyltransferase